MTQGESQAPLQRMESTQFAFDHTFCRDNPGKIEDFYELDKQLGEGSFGSAHHAICKNTKAERAVKCIEQKKVKNPSRLEREIEIQRSFDHPNVVRLFETFRDAKKIYLVMELCTGGELFDRIVDDAPGGFDELKGASYIRQMLAALAYMHANRFAHRDVKPENFLLSSRDEKASLKIIDFGLAFHYEPGQLMETKAGTAYYVAPEVLAGKYDEKCDIWSAGVISFILLCGYPPFAGDTDKDILKKVKAGTWEFKSPEWDPISSGAKNIITQMLTVDPSLRLKAEDLLNSPWLKFKATPEVMPISKDFVSRLQAFRAHTKLKKVALTVLAQQLNDDKVESLQKLFKSLDANGDGTLSIEEIKAGMEKQGMKVPQAFEDLIKSVDCNRSGHLDYTEFLATMIDQKLYKQRDMLWAAFRVFDLDGDGKITREELGQVLSGGNVKNALGAQKIEKMIAEVDLNGDGVIDFDEFCKMMIPPKSNKRKSHAMSSAVADADPLLRHKRTEFDDVHT